MNTNLYIYPTSVQSAHPGAHPSQYPHAPAPKPTRFKAHPKIGPAPDPFHYRPFAPQTEPRTAPAAATRSPGIEPWVVAGLRAPIGASPEEVDFDFDWEAFIRKEKKARERERNKQLVQLPEHARRLTVAESASAESDEEDIDAVERKARRTRKGDKGRPRDVSVPVGEAYPYAIATANTPAHHPHPMYLPMARAGTPPAMSVGYPQYTQAPPQTGVPRALGMHAYPTRK
ncbi:hypothetical protein MKEN_01109200 [Mycena kentingensis (nom. inval.)]|nr:hypothetical protein MKEN_01109200 [Mycena kentingensis (nom. inval.)]